MGWDKARWQLSEPLHEFVQSICLRSDWRMDVPRGGRDGDRWEAAGIQAHLDPTQAGWAIDLCKGVGGDPVWTCGVGLETRRWKDDVACGGAAEYDGDGTTVKGEARRRERRRETVGGARGSLGSAAGGR